MITKIKFTEHWTCFFKNQSFEFKPVTLLVGDQGCGKSTMLGVLKYVAQAKDKTNLGGLKVWQDNNELMTFKMFDMESNNPRTNPKDTYSQEGLKDFFGVSMSSHGEALFPIIKHITKSEKCLVLIDEPETSLSLRSQYKFVEMVKKAVSNGCQIILSTHCLVFMEAFSDSILSLEHNKYVTSEQFIKLEKKENNFKDKRNDKMVKLTKCTMGNNCECANKTNWYNKNCINYICPRTGKKNNNKKEGKEPWNLKI